MRLINIRLGILGMIVGLVVILVFNQTITEFVGWAEPELKLILYMTWIAMCFFIAAYAPMGITVEDQEQ